MKKRTGMLWMIGCVIALTGCGSGKSQATEEQALQKGSSDVIAADQTEDAQSNEDTVLAGVYLNGGSLETIPMGTYFQGNAEVFCRVKMPTQYLVAAGNMEEDGTDKTIEQASGSTVLKTALEDGLLDQGYVIYDVYLLSAKEDASEVRFCVESADTFTWEELNESVSDAVTFGTEQHPAIYYEEEGYEAADLLVGICLNEDAIISVSYKGPLAEQMGLEQLAQNIYDLVEITD
jgi:hypothetical protein